MEKIKAIVIDDENHARILLRGMLNTFCPDVEIVGESGDLPNGVKVIRKQKPDIVFLDIEMPGHSGLELLDFFDEEEITFSVVFTTAYHQYAVKAFKLSALDYLLKPISPQDLEDTVKRFNRERRGLRTQYEHLKEMMSPSVPRSIAVPIGSGFKFLPVDQIMYIKADGSYTEIAISNGEKIVASRTLKNFEDVLCEDERFMRTHKSYIVNVGFVRELVKTDGGFLVMEDKEQISVTPEKMKELIDKNSVVKR